MDPQNINLITATKSNIIEAFIKSIEFIKKFKTNTNGLDSNFKLFILTYKQMNFSSFSEIWDEFIKDHINKENLLDQNDILILPPTNVYIISIVEFESLVSILNSKKVSIIDILSYIDEQENNGKTKKYAFNDYLEHYKENYSEISFLKDEFDNSILSKIKDRLLRKDFKKR